MNRSVATTTIFLRTGRLVLAGAMIAALAACGSTTRRSFSNPAYPIAKVQRVAVLGFDGVPDANAAGDVLAMMLAQRQVFAAVLDRAQIQAVVAEHRLPADLLADESALARRGLLQADALLKGRVTRFDQGVPAYPLATPTVIAMSLKLVSSETGQTIWTHLYSKSSVGRGLLAPEVDEMMLEMAEEVADDLARLRR
jgi:hypothetical protein